MKTVTLKPIVSSTISVSLFIIERIFFLITPLLEHVHFMGRYSELDTKTHLDFRISVYFYKYTARETIVTIRLMQSKSIIF